MDIVTRNIVKDNFYGHDCKLQLLWKTVEKDSLLRTSHWRYDKFHGIDYQAALEFLRLFAQVPSASETELEEIHNRIKQRRDDKPPGFRRILHVLETDLYIMKNDTDITFHNKVLRDLLIQERGIN